MWFLQVYPDHLHTSGVFIRATYGAQRGFRAAKLVSLLTWQNCTDRLTVPPLKVGSGLGHPIMVVQGYGDRDDRQAALILLRVNLSGKADYQ